VTNATALTPNARLEALLAPAVVHALQDLVDERVRAELGAHAAAGTEHARRWFTIPEAAIALGCSPDAIRMRIARGRLEHRRQGRRVYVSAAAIDELR
jgi:excisionase family DNA binding protein